VLTYKSICFEYLLISCERDPLLHLTGNQTPQVKEPSASISKSGCNERSGLQSAVRLATASTNGGTGYNSPTKEGGVPTCCKHECWRVFLCTALRCLCDSHRWRQAM